MKASNIFLFLMALFLASSSSSQCEVIHLKWIMLDFFLVKMAWNAHNVFTHKGKTITN